MFKTKDNLTLTSLVGITGLAGILLTLPTVSAGTEAVDTVTITVPSACSMSGTITTGNEHNATVDSGTYVDDIGETSLKTICNDSNGFSIYAIGYTNDEYGNTVLKSSLDTTSNVITGTATSGNTSNWAMKLEAGSGTYAPTIETDTNGSFANYHVIPSTYTKVATFNSTTDATNGSTLTTTYAVYMNPTQPAGTYTGKVKYTLIHPVGDPAPYTGEITQSGKIGYYANAPDVVGTMGEQDVLTPAKDWSQCVSTNYSSYCYDSSHNNIINSLPDTDYTTVLALLASNYSREGYGFVGWSDAFDYATNQNAHFYGPNETIIVPNDVIANGLSLYAVWVPSAGSFQDSTKVAELCGAGQGSLTTAPINGTANLDSVSALTDERDNQTYAIAKLADGKCWMIENLRLEAENTRTAEKKALAQGYGTSTAYGNFGGLADAEFTGFSIDYTANSLYYSVTQEGTASINIGISDYTGYRVPRYNNINTSARASSPTTNNGNIYSYGNYYTWHAAIADTTYYNDSEDHNTTSICPTGWGIPLGTDSGNGDMAGAFYYLNYKLNGDSNVTSSTDSNKLRGYPNNFLYSGYYNQSSADLRGNYGYYWSSTASGLYSSDYLNVNIYSVAPGNVAMNKHVGQSIRCLAL